MRGKFAAGVAAVLALTAPAAATAGPPAPADPQNWTFQDNLTWNDYKPLPGPDYSDPSLQPSVKKWKVALVLTDFPDKGFFISQPAGSTIYGTPTLDANTPYDEDELKEIVRKAILQGNQYVLNEAHRRGNDMGTTITMALVAGDRAVIGNVGDSRTYIYRDGKLRRISKDHSLVMRLVELGQITEEDIYLSLIHISEPTRPY